jgi:type II secretory pathway pseudopilin PulG
MAGEAHGRGRARRARGAGGFTIVEVMIVMVLLLVAFVAMSQSIVSSMRLTVVNRDTRLATDGLREMVERMQGEEDFATLFARYNADPGDDPPGFTSPGSGFAVAGLQAVDGDADGLPGEIVFPTVEFGGALELHEDLVDERLGMPRHLTGAGSVAALDPAGASRLLPVALGLRWWVGRGGERTMAIRTLIADR